MTDDLRFERMARDWLELGPVEAPAHVVQAAFDEITTTRQERDLLVPRRLTEMPMLLRLAAAVLAITIVGGGAYLFLRDSAAPAGVGAPGTATPVATTPSPSPSPTLPSQVIPDGTYLGAPIRVADILTDLANDATLSESDRTAIIDSVLGIRGATTYQTRIVVHGTAAEVSQGVDGTFNPESWTFVPIGATRIRANGVEFDVGGCDDPANCAFTLHARTAAPSAMEAFVRHLVFELAGPFTLQP